MNVNWPEIQGSPRPPKAGHKRLSEPNKRVVGCVTTAAIFIWGSVFTFYTVVAFARSAVSQSCVINLQELSQGMLQYSADNDGYLPPSHLWLDLEPLPNARDIGCPEAVGPEGPGYAMLAALSSKQTSTIQAAANTPLIFDSSLTGWNAAASLDSLPNPPRHGTKWPPWRQGLHNNVAYADGHASRLAAGSRP